MLLVLLPDYYDFSALATRRPKGGVVNINNPPLMAMTIVLENPTVAGEGQWVRLG